MGLIRASIPRQEFIAVIDQSIEGTDLSSESAEWLRKAARTMTVALRGNMRALDGDTLVHCPLSYTGLYKSTTPVEDEYVAEGGGQFIARYDDLTGQVFVGRHRADVLDIIDD